MSSKNQLGKGLWVWLVISALIALAYIAAGIFLIKIGDSVQFLSPKMQLVLGIALILYGVFRIYRIYTRYYLITENKQL